MEDVLLDLDVTSRSDGEDARDPRSTRGAPRMACVRLGQQISCATQMSGAPENHGPHVRTPSILSGTEPRRSTAASKSGTFQRQLGLQDQPLEVRHVEGNAVDGLE
eukprot:14300249-Heterocapsa_arctica.AAC.1